MIEIDGIKTEIRAGETILSAAKRLCIDVPTLCHLEGLMPDGSCRMCVCQVEGRKGLLTACSTPCEDGMKVYTDTEEIRLARRFVLELILSRHEGDCLSCGKSGVCELQQLCLEYGVNGTPFKKVIHEHPVQDENPFFNINLKKCIGCRRCVRVCRELQCNSAIAMIGRGDGVYPGTAVMEGSSSCDGNDTLSARGGILENHDCVHCGSCVDVCPTGARTPKSHKAYAETAVRKVRTVCPYCGVGCGMDLLVKGREVVGAKPAAAPPNDGLMCVKGRFAMSFINHPDRLQTPLIRRNGGLEPASWEEALELVTGRFGQIKKDFGPDALAGLSSAKATNEENYLFQKFMRKAVGTNNVDHCARLCHASTVAGLRATLGSGAMTGSIGDIANADTIFIIGSNTTETHPVIGAKVRQALRNGTRLIVADPRYIQLAVMADIYLPIRPGTNVALLNGMMRVILQEGLWDEEFVKKHTQGIEKLKEALVSMTAEDAADICGVSPDAIYGAARLYASSPSASILYAMGITQHTTGTDGVMSVSNLALLCGKIGRPGCGVNPLRGQNNVQGACDMGALPGDFPGYQSVRDPAALKKFEEAWGAELPSQPGLTSIGMMDAAIEGRVKAMYIMGENPALSEPDTAHVIHGLESLDFLVVQDIFLTETAAFADVVLPTASFAEKSGTFTNTERRVQLIRPAIPPVGESRTDGEILIELTRRLGCPQEDISPAGVMDEIAGLTPQYGGISHDRLEKQGSLQWPCPNPGHPGTPVLHVGGFAKGKADFVPVQYIRAPEQTDVEYPLVLTTGRILAQFHTRTMTGREDGLNKTSGEPFAEVHTADAKRLGLSEGETVRISSRRGSIKIRVRLRSKGRKGTVFVPFHFAQAAANVLTYGAVDPVAGIPGFKVCAVKVEKTPEGERL